ncbi:uncharacterized protein LOC129569137 [Sitodiplosis mosellana]|uniref:uncharacterized protein LOC129569137 n=1 Tax=Sitodiplosis mosellana TaxID=263140 RepID=UPI0024450C35|nr:uncharacterized protein LOC129569137 [Sitodiplosis mosellana]
MTNRRVKEYETAMISGWGYETNPKFVIEDIPKQNEVLKYGEIYNHSGICATGKSSIVRSAISDMGAPMIYPSTTELAGLGNFRHLQAPYAEHDIFFDVYVYAEWIQNNMCANDNTVNIDVVNEKNQCC